MDFPHGEKLRFLVAGTTTTLCTYLLYWTLLLALDPRVAYPIACTAGVGMSYTLSSLWVFKRAWTHKGLVFFLVGYGAQTVVAYGVFLVLIAYTRVADWFAPVLVTILLLPLTFLMNRELVHRSSPAPSDPGPAPGAASATLPLGPRIKDALWIAALAAGLPLLAMSLLGVDGNWDMRNYHLYNVHAWLTGRSHDVAPAMLQSWHNPLLDTPMYLLFNAGVPTRVVAVWLVLPTMVSLALLLLLQRALATAPPSRTSQVVLALLALTGAASYSTLATTTNDAFVGAAMLGALWLVLGTAQAGWQRWLLAGVVAGAIAGLKLSASFYCIALAFAALSLDGLRANVLRLGSLAAGGVLGFALSFGWWGLKLARELGNPFVPYFNNLFHSPLLAPDAFADARFRPVSALEHLLAPVRLLFKSTRFSELNLSDPRLLLGLVALLALLWLGRRGAAPADIGQRLRRLLMFFVVALALWIAQYGIYRYAIVLELLGSLVLVLLISRLPRWQPALLVLALLLVSADTRRPDWGRVPAMAPRAAMADAGLPRDALVVSAQDEPMAYFALALPADTPFLGLGTNIVRYGECSGLRARADAALQAHAGPVWLLRTRALAADEAPRRMLEDEYGLYEAGACRDYRNELGPLQLCPLQRRPVAPRCQASGG